MTAKYTLPSAANPANAWRMAAIALLAVRFVQGWIYWGGRHAPLHLWPTKARPGGPLDGL